MKETTFPYTIVHQNKRLDPDPNIDPDATVYHSRLGHYTEIGAGWKIHESVIDDYSYCAPPGGTIIYTEIGKFANIAPMVAINPGNHPIDRVTQHHCTYRRAMYGFDVQDDTRFFQWRRESRCVVGHDTWIGWGAAVMAGVTIGHGSVIGAGAVVTRDIGLYEIAVGVPAKVVRKRFPDAVIEKLLQIAWWDWDRFTLEDRFDDIASDDIDAFVEKYG